MKALKERILRDGKCFEGGILKVDNFKSGKTRRAA